MGAAFQGEFIVHPGWWLEENRGEWPASYVAESLNCWRVLWNFYPTADKWLFQYLQTIQVTDFPSLYLDTLKQTHRAKNYLVHILELKMWRKPPFSKMVSSEHQTSVSFLPNLVASEKVSLSVGSVFFRAELILKSNLRISLSGSVYIALHREECEFSAVWLWTGRDIDWLSLQKQCIFLPLCIFLPSLQVKLSKRNSCGLKRLVIIQMVSLRISLLDRLKLKSFSKVEHLLDGFKYTTAVCVYVCVCVSVCRYHWPISSEALSLKTAKTSSPCLWSCSSEAGRVPEGTFNGSRNCLWGEAVSQTPTSLSGVGGSWHLWELPFSTSGVRWSNHTSPL